MPPLFPLTLALYAVACTLYCVAVAQPQLGTLARAARLVLALAFVSHAVDIGWLCLHGHSPSSEAREAVFFAAWAAIGVLLLFTVRTPLPVVAVLVAPLALFLIVAARLAPAEMPRTASVLRSLHIFCATLGLALFTVAAGTSIIYLLTERQLKGHHLGQLGKRGPALFTLDALGRRSILLGFAVFTLALVTGGVFLASHATWTAAALLQPQYLLSIVTWVLYAVLLVSRAAYGMRGRRAALLTLIGYAAAMGVLLIYYLRGLREGL